jgi:hypothetical protein
MSNPSQPTALALNCTLTPGPAESSTQLMAEPVLEALGKHGVTGVTGVTGESIRASTST